MRKLTLLTATALTLTCLGGGAITSEAASNNWNSVTLKGNRVIVTYGSGCDVQALMEQLGNCLPSVSLPGCSLPGVNTPETNVPETETPDANAPETNIPETETPDTNAPETNIPETEAPDTNAPETNIPEIEAPDVNTPGTNTPDSSDKNDTTEDNNSTSEHAFIQEVVNLVNAERAKEGLSPLTIDVKVQAAAQVRAKECEQSFSHTRPNGSSFSTALQEQNVSYRSAGENIAWGQRTPEAVMNAWMNSEGHRANIMNANFTTIGVGYYQNANGTNYWCQLFTR